LESFSHFDICSKVPLCYNKETETYRFIYDRLLYEVMPLHNSLDMKGTFIAVSMVPACTTEAFHDVITGPAEWFAIKLVRSFQEEAVNSAMNENRKYLKDFQFCKEVVKRR